MIATPDFKNGNVPVAVYQLVSCTSDTVTDKKPPNAVQNNHTTIAPQPLHFVGLSIYM